MLEFAQTVNALGTVVIGVLVGYVAWRQHKTDADRLLAERFDRRCQVFKTAISAFSDVLRDAPSDQIQRHWTDIAWIQAHFAFGDEVRAIIGEMRNKLIRLQILSEELRTPADGRDRLPLAIEKTKLIAEFGQLYDTAIDLTRAELSPIRRRPKSPA